MKYNILTLFFLFIWGYSWAQCPGPGQRNALLNLERSLVVEGTKAGQIPLTDTCGNQRYAQYVEVNLTPIAYIPTPTGNTQNLSEFVVTSVGSRLFYIDWQGNAVEFVGGGGSCDTDWLEIGNNLCPDAITDSIYKYKYVSIGARSVWPTTELQVADSTDMAIEILNGFRGARLVLYNNNTQLFSTLSQEGSDFTHYLYPDGVATWKTAGGGTPEAPALPFTNHFSINTNDSTVQLWRYPRTRVDTQYVLNFLYTDGVGKIRSKPVTAIPGIGNGIYGGSGAVNDGTKATLATGATFEFDYNAGGSAIQIIDPLQTTISSGNGSYSMTASLTQVDIDAPASNLRVSTGSISGSAATVSFPTSGGVVKIGGGNSASELRFQEPSGSGVNYSAFKAQAQAGNVTYTLPAADGSSGNVLSTNGSGTLSWAASGGSGTVTSFSSGNLSPLFTTSVATATTTPALSFSLDTHTANTVFAGPTTGVPAAPTFRALVAADLPAGTGTVTSVGLSMPAIFSVSGSPVTTSGTLTASLANETANTVFAGPTSGGAAAPTFRTLVAADIPSSAAGDFFKDGGNSFGAAATLGTNDNNTLSFETNNVTRATVTAGASTGGAWTATDITANTNTTETMITTQVNSSGTPAANFGFRHLVQLESTTTDNRDASDFITDWSTATDASRTSRYKIRLVSSAGAFADHFVFTPGSLSIGNSSGANACAYSSTGISATAAYTIGASGNNFTLGNASGAILITRNTATTNAVVPFNFRANSTGTPANGLGPQLLLQGETSTTTDQDMGAIASIWTDVTNASRTADMTFSTVNNAAALAEKMRLTAAGRLGIGDTSPETDLDVTGTTGTGHLIGQDNTPTITVTTAGAGTGATASMTNAQSSDLAGRFSITTGTGSTTGKWCDVSFGSAFATTPIVQVYCEDDDCSILTHYVNVSTTGFEWFVTSASVDSRTYNMSFIIIGGK